MTYILLNVSANAKTVKGNIKGYLTGILYLAPHTEAGIVDANGKILSVCRSASAGCIAGCLYDSGRAKVFQAIKTARIRKTRELFSDESTFIKRLFRDIAILVADAESQDMIPCVRLNGTSDLDWTQYILNGQNVFQRFPNVQFYDYMKHNTVLQGKPDNLHYTFSFSGTNAKLASLALAQGTNVAVVVRNKKLKEAMLSDSRYIDGDVDDLRFLDASSKIVLLTAKGNAKQDMTGFVIDKADDLQKLYNTRSQQC